MKKTFRSFFYKFILYSSMFFSISLSSCGSDLPVRKYYTITWNVDGFITSEDYEYGATPTFKGNTDKASDQQYTYTFTGWSPNIETVTQDITYVALYDKETNSYSITWKNYDGTLLDVEPYKYGDEPIYKGEAPTREKDQQYTYTFTGWSPNIETVTQDITYVAQYSKSVNHYVVTWNVDGDITTEDYEYGSIPTFKGSTDKSSDQQYTYTFTGWSPNIETVTQDITYVAQYSKSVNCYTITWNVDGFITSEDYEYGATPTFKGNTDKASDQQYTYTFTGWSPNIETVTQDITYVAQYSKSVNRYTITWSVDGNITIEDYAYGDFPIFKGSTDKSSDQQYTYTFTGWSPNIETVTQDITYVAQYSISLKKYLVTFLNYDGSFLYSAYFNYGTTAIYGGSIPERAEENYKSYVFAGWTEELSNIKSDLTVYACFDVFDVYEFIFYDGTKQIVKVPEYSDIKSKMPQNTPVSDTRESEIKYYWTAQSQYKYIEERTVRYKYYITYHLDGGSNDNNPSWIFENETIALNDCSKDGYIFEGWFIDPEYGTQITELSSLKSDIHLYAKFVIASYQITYHLDGGTNAPKNPDYYTIQDVIELKNPVKTGYTFVGWFKDPEMHRQVSVISNQTGNLDLYACFSANTYSGSFNSNSGSFNNLKLILVNNNGTDNTIVELHNNESINLYRYCPTKEGYVFEGWYFDVFYSRRVITPDGRYSVDKDTMLYARFIQIPDNCYEINRLRYPKSTEWKFRGNDRTRDFIVPGNVSAVKIYLSIYGSYNTGFLSYGECYLNGVYISGSHTTSEHSTVNNSLIVECQPGDIITCVGSSDNDSCKIWLEINATEKAYFSQSETSRSADFTYDAEPLPPDVVKEGYNFDGWLDDEGNILGNIWNYDSPQSFVAQWSPIIYSITYDLNGGTNHPDNPSTYTIEDSFSLGEASKYGHTFVGWYLDSNFAMPISSIENMTGDITLFAKFIINTYSLELDGNGGVFSPKIQFFSDSEIIHTVYLHQNETIASFYPENKEGFMFAGWYLDSDFKSIFNFNGTIKNDLNLYAKWIQVSTDTIKADVDNTKEIYIDGKNETLIAFTPIADGQITIKSDSSLDLVGSLLDSGKNLLICNDDISDMNLNFSFTYWVKAGETYYISTAGNTILSVGSANLIIEWAGNTTILGVTYESKISQIIYGDSFVLPDKVEREGYIFVGWFDENGVQYDGGEWIFDQNIKLIAVWEQII